METGTGTLAESLLDDLDDLSDVEEVEEAETAEGGLEGEEDDAADQDMETNNDNEEHGRDGQETIAGAGAEVLKSKSKRKRLLNENNPKDPLQAHLAMIDKMSNDNHEMTEEEQHALITQSNKFLTTLESELHKAYLDLTTAYDPKFPELKELLPDPILYRRAVGVLQNEMDATVVNEPLNSIAGLTSNQIITLSVAGSTTSGRPLLPAELHSVNETAEYLDAVLDARFRLVRFVESRMERLAPNTCAIVGATVAAKMVGIAGGLAELGRIPGCNLQVLGQVRHTSSSRAGFGMSLVSANASSSLLRPDTTTTTDTIDTDNTSNTTLTTTAPSPSLPHAGILTECELYQRVPSHLQRKALKVIANKLALAVRCDHVNVESGRVRTGQHGIRFRSEIEQKFIKWEEPDKAPVVKALPNCVPSHLFHYSYVYKHKRIMYLVIYQSIPSYHKRIQQYSFVPLFLSFFLPSFFPSFITHQSIRPDLTTKKRRGGKRIQRLKERFQETELMKQANRRGFSTEVGEYGDDAMGLTLGMLESKEGTNNIRRSGMDNKRKMRQANTKASRKRAVQMSSGQTNGLASSMVFTPVQGLELVNPDANKDRVRDANLKWFGENAGFQSALPKR